MNQWMKGWMDAWASYTFLCWANKLALHWATSLLRHLFSQLLPALNRLPASTSVASATRFWNARWHLLRRGDAFHFSARLALWSRTAFVQLSDLQLQSKFPGALQHHSCFAARSRADAFCHSQLQTHITGASNQIDQHSHSAHNQDASAPLRESFPILMPNQALISLLHILPTSSSKSASKALDRIWPTFS